MKPKRPMGREEKVTVSEAGAADGLDYGIGNREVWPLIENYSEITARGYRRIPRGNGRPARWAVMRKRDHDCPPNWCGRRSAYKQNDYKKGLTTSSSHL